jgi:hypothetical protein
MSRPFFAARLVVGDMPPAIEDVSMGKVSRSSKRMLRISRRTAHAWLVQILEARRRRLLASCSRRSSTAIPYGSSRFAGCSEIYWYVTNGEPPRRETLSVLGFYPILRIAARPRRSGLGVMNSPERGLNESQLPGLRATLPKRPDGVPFWRAGEPFPSGLDRQTLQAIQPCRHRHFGEEDALCRISGSGP